MCESKHCNRKGCENHVPENRTDGFCSGRCKETDKVMKFIALKDSYKELPISHTMLLDTKSETKEKKICALPGCTNTVKKRGKRAKYCSLNCSIESKKKYGVINCEHCTTPFQSNRFRKHFCSRQCHLDHIKVERFCENPECKRKLNSHKGVTKFCSRECYSKVRSASVVRYTNCQNEKCNKELSEAQYQNKQLYCGKACYHEHRKEKMGDGIGKITMRKEKHWEYPRRFIKTEKGWILLSRYTWEKENGPLPANHFIAYKDGNTFNDEDVKNLFSVHISNSLKYNKPISSEDVEIKETETSVEEFFNLKDNMI